MSGAGAGVRRDLCIVQHAAVRRPETGQGGSGNRWCRPTCDLLGVIVSPATSTVVPVLLAVDPSFTRWPAGPHDGASMALRFNRARRCRQTMG